MRLSQSLINKYVSRFVTFAALLVITVQNCHSVDVFLNKNDDTSCFKGDVDPDTCAGLDTSGCHGATFWKETTAGNGTSFVYTSQMCQYIQDTCDEHGCMGDGSTTFYFQATTDTVKCNSGFYGYDNSAYCNSSCTKGHYCPGGEYKIPTLGESLKACAIGTYQAATGASSCNNCNNGKYQNQTGQTECKDCPAGSFSSNDGSAYSACTKCASGYYQTSTGQNTCKSCTNKPASATYKANETGVSKSNACSWFNEKCHGNMKYDATNHSCTSCEAGYHSKINWETPGLDGICFSYERLTTYLCKSDYTEITSLSYNNAKECVPNQYTLNIYAEYQQSGTTVTKFLTQTTLTYSSEDAQSIYSVYSGLKNVSTLLTTLNGTPTTDKYYALTTPNGAYLKINGTNYNLNTSYSETNTNAGWIMTPQDHDTVLRNLANGSTINLYLKIAGKPYEVYMITGGLYSSVNPSSRYGINKDQPIAVKYFGNAPATGVAPNKNQVTSCSYTGGTSAQNVYYGYIPDTAAALYYECDGKVPTQITNNNGSSAMFEPSRSGLHICIAYNMSTCEAGYKCESCKRDACDKGTYQNATGTNSCNNCSDGYVTPDDNSPHTSCNACNNGKYQKSGNKTTCQQCDAGTFTSSTGAHTSCSGCGKGTYSAAGASQCTPCPNGTYQSAEKQPHCLSCQDGTTTTDETTGLFTSAQRATSRNKCYINTGISLTDDEATKSLTALGISEKIYWQGNN